MNRRSAFTLAEVLIALALLGVVAAFTVPQVLLAMEDTHKKALFKEGVGMVSQALSQAYLDGSWTGNADPIFREKLNIISTDTPVLGGDGIMQYGYTLKNGVWLYYRDGVSPAQEAFVMDYNGTQQGPNQMFQDRMSFWANMSKQTCCCGIKPGGIGVVNPQVCPGDQPPWVNEIHTTQEIYDFYYAMVVQ